MNRIITLMLACVLATSVSIRDGTAGLPIADPDRSGVLNGAPSATEKVAFQVIGLMKTKSGAT